MPITTPPTAPSRADPTTFPARADAWVAWQESSLVPQINALEANVNAKEASTVAAAATAQAAITSINTALNRYTFSTSTTMSDPGVGIVRFNNATLASVTAIAMDAQSADAGNPNIIGLLANFGASDSAIKGLIRFTQAGTPSTFAAFNITAVVNNTGWVQLTVTHVASAGSFTNGASFVMEFHRTGDSGDAQVLRDDLASSSAGKGAELVAASGGSGANAFATVAGFIGRIVSTVGASLVGFAQAGAGAQPRTVETKLREVLLSRTDFGTSTEFDVARTANPTIPNLDGGGNFGARLTPTAEPAQLALADAVQTVCAGPRDALIYAGEQSVRVVRNFATMGGFRFRGQYSRGRAPTFAMPTNKTVTAPADLGGMTAKTDENWYAVFACANNGDTTATLKLMPFLRAGVVSGSNVPLTKAGEGISTNITQSYAWTANNNLANTDCLVIFENGGWSGRVTKITANATSQITLQTVGTVAAGDFLLPAPPGFAHYVYLGSVYYDTAEVRNFYDTGSVVKGKMIYLLSPNNTAGSVAAPGITFNAAGYISPLASAVIIDSTLVLSTASTGDYAEYYDPDGANHIVQTKYTYKTLSGSSQSVVFDGVDVPFLYPQKFNFYNAGGLASARFSAQLNVTGWIES